MAKILTWSDYKNLGESKDLKFLESFTPRNHTTKCRWRCLLCGREMVKSYRIVSDKPVSCYCRSTRTLDVSKYHALANRLGITFLPEDGNLPQNNKDMVKWLGRSGETVEASYFELYRVNRIPKRLKEPLGLE